MYVENEFKTMLMEGLKALKCDTCPFDVLSCKNECDTMRAKLGRARIVRVEE